MLVVSLLLGLGMAFAAAATIVSTNGPSDGTAFTEGQVRRSTRGTSSSTTAADPSSRRRRCRAPGRPCGHRVAEQRSPTPRTVRSHVNASACSAAAAPVDSALGRGPRSRSTTRSHLVEVADEDAGPPSTIDSRQPAGAAVGHGRGGVRGGLDDAEPPALLDARGQGQPGRRRARRAWSPRRRGRAGRRGRHPERVRPPRAPCSLHQPSPTTRSRRSGWRSREPGERRRGRARRACAARPCRGRRAGAAGGAGVSASQRGLGAVVDHGDRRPR